MMCKYTSSSINSTNSYNCLFLHCLKAREKEFRTIVHVSHPKDIIGLCSEVELTPSNCQVLHCMSYTLVSLGCTTLVSRKVRVHKTQCCLGVCTISLAAISQRSHAHQCMSERVVADPFTHKEKGCHTHNKLIWKSGNE